MFLADAFKVESTETANEAATGSNGLSPSLMCRGSRPSPDEGDHERGRMLQINYEKTAGL
jgi:hypothetical protein